MIKAYMDRLREILRRERKGLGLVLLLAGLMMWLAGTFISKVRPGPPLPRPEPGPYSAQQVKLRTYPLVIDQVGDLRASTEALVASRIMAQVKKILVTQGTPVVGTGDGKPTVMALLDDREIQARLHQAEAQVAAMRRTMEAAKAKLGAGEARVEAVSASKKKVLSDYRRYESLYRQQAATGQQLEHARAQKEIAEAEESVALRDVDAAQEEIKRIQAQMEDSEAAAAAAHVMLSYTVIQAPFTGRVVKKMVDVGDMAAPGQPLFFLEIPSRPELQAFVSDSLIYRLRIGQELSVHIDALKRTYQGTLREIVPKADPATRTVVVKVSLPPVPDLVTGLFGRLSVPYGQYEALVVPLKAVREVGQLNLVDVVNSEGYPERRFVTLGQHHDDLVEVLSGLKENEKIIVP
jgi:HlyD family secretion protein